MLKIISYSLFKINLFILHLYIKRIFFVNIIINIRTIFDDLASQSLIEIVWILLFSGGECRSEAEEDRDASNSGQKGGGCLKIVFYKKFS